MSLSLVSHDDDGQGQIQRRRRKTGEEADIGLWGIFPCFFEKTHTQTHTHSSQQHSVDGDFFRHVAHLDLGHFEVRWTL